MFLIFLATILGSLVSLIGAFLLSRKKTWDENLSLQLTAFASGVMLSTALLHLAPESIHEGLGTEAVFSTIFGAIVFFFLIERSVVWFHHHHEAGPAKPTALLVTIGDSVHNFIDGVAIATSFMVNPALGILTTLAVGFHEIPQEIADFITLIRSGVKQPKALLLNVASAAVALLGAGTAVILAEPIQPFLPYAIAFSAGMFLYIALSDLIPELHHHTKHETNKWLQIVWFFAGIGVMVTTTQVVEGLVHEENVEAEQVEITKANSY